MDGMFIVTFNEGRTAVGPFNSYEEARDWNDSIEYGRIVELVTPEDIT